MHYLHHDEFMILQLRSFLVVIEEGSLHRAAARLNLSQSALSRQMQALEHELGGKLLERNSTGVRPTLGGHAMAAKVRALLGNYDSANSHYSEFYAWYGRALSKVRNGS